MPRTNSIDGTMSKVHERMHWSPQVVLQLVRMHFRGGRVHVNSPNCKTGLLCILFLQISYALVFANLHAAHLKSLSSVKDIHPSFNLSRSNYSHVQVVINV